jgi:PAS domain S-box-containing protein
MRNKSLPFLVLICDRHGILLAADDAFQELKVEESIFKLTQDSLLPFEYPAVYNTRQGLLTLYPFRAEALKLDGYIGLLATKDLENETIARLTEENQELMAIFEGVHDGVSLSDKNGRIIRLNRGFERLSGIPRDEVLMRTAEHGEKVGLWSASATMRALETKKSVTFNNEYRYHDETRMGVVTATPVFDASGVLLGAVCNIRDITQINKLRDELIESQLQLYKYSRVIRKLNLGRELSGSQMVYRSAVMDKLTQRALKYAEVTAPLLITGESGTGKEVLADMIFENSNRKDKPFLKINCGAIPDTLLESELFGYEEGAFTGAKKGGRLGLFELANNGTVLLDEIGEISLGLQTKLLRLIEKQEFYRVGGNKLHKVDVRVISATNRSLEEMVAAKQFRLDLYHRLKVLHLHIPPLRERSEDILPLVDHFMGIYNQRYGTNKKLSSAVLNRFFAHSWPGNIREIANLVEQLVVVSDGPQILPTHLPDELRMSSQNGTDSETSGYEALTGLGEIIDRYPDFREARAAFEKEYLRQALQKYGSLRSTAKHIGLTHPSLIVKVDRYSLKIPKGKVNEIQEH